MAITLPNEYGYVLLAASSTFFVNTLHTMLTSSARKKSGIKYPNSYASAEQADKDPKAFAFNCAQRAHNNFTENLTPFLGALLISGLRYPVYAAGLGALWSAGRVMFALGYTSSGPQGRILGSALGALSDIVLKLAAAYTALGFALEW
ncbi:hypothetical protein C8A05DRAFT_31225 [Staphylotrichum tortipilum]|uniref:Microsomal glutathione S-transferase 3 n=1 Tax=Staphylotrichum tortipilum TaxID=2831512 RepID=A0AAN6RWE5_9PEZI|nr:hypothetical protein C8A05DRAFT_31225 [Staphylotrichum longicolle]